MKACFLYKSLHRCLFCTMVLLSLLHAGNSYATSSMLLAKNKVAKTVIALPESETAGGKFAAGELAKYLQRISGANFRVVKPAGHVSSAILIQTDLEKGKEDYSILLHNRRLVISGGSDRALLYAVYDLLEKLGCRWLAPGFSFYNGTAEFVPQKPVLYYNNIQPVNEHPVFAYRKLDVEEGQTHTIENLKQLIDWMPKLRFNTLMIPINYQGENRVKWEKWRKQLTPELKKRGLMIEVGGHGYQNFMNAAMDNGNLFKQHPEWFGSDKACKPSKAEYMVFNTADTGAMHYFTNQVIAYLKSHPEIDIFDFWPPDGAHWADCPDWLRRGAPEDRQARLLNHIDSAVKAYRPDLKLEIIAYAKTIMPPQMVKMNKGILVDICPIDQNFETQLYDTVAAANINYIKAICSWRNKFEGNIGLYSYFRKYAWKSLPNVIPHYIKNDIEWCAAVPMQAITTYAEPGDWYTYELNHYLLGRLAWNPETAVDRLIDEYCRIRYGNDAALAQKTYALLERTVRVYGSIRNSSLKSKTAINNAIGETEEQIDALEKARTIASQPIAANLLRLKLMMQYAAMDMHIRAMIAGHEPRQAVADKVGELLAFLKKNIAAGTFLLTAHDDINHLMTYNYTDK